jgi:hypothetical protein
VRMSTQHIALLSKKLDDVQTYTLNIDSECCHSNGCKSDAKWTEFVYFDMVAYSEDL